MYFYILGRLNIYSANTIIDPGDSCTYFGKKYKILQTIFGVRLFFSSLNIESSSQLEESIHETLSSTNWHLEFTRLHNCQVLFESLPLVTLKAFIIVICLLKSFFFDLFVFSFFFPNFICNL